MIALTFVKYFEWGKTERNSLELMGYITANAYTPAQIKHAIINTYPLFENIEIQSHADIATKYAINQLTTQGKGLTLKNIKPEIMAIYTNPNFYTDPTSFIIESEPIPNRALEPLGAYEFPINNEQVREDDASSKDYAGDEDEDKNAMSVEKRLGQQKRPKLRVPAIAEGK
jgi:hypothetical protein